MNKENFVDALPQNMKESRIVHFFLRDKSLLEGEAHVIAIKILREDNRIRYRVFDPNAGETRKLDNQLLKSALSGLFNFYEDLAEYEVEDAETLINQYSLKERGRKKYPKARFIDCIDDSITSSGDNTINAIKCMLEAGADINYGISTGENALGNACIKGRNVHVVKFLIEKGGEIPLTPWLYALALNSLGGNREMVKILWEKGPYCPAGSWVGFLYGIVVFTLFAYFSFYMGQYQDQKL